MRVNMKFMRWFMCTKAAQVLEWGCITYAQALGRILQRCAEEDHTGIGILLVHIHEPSSSLSALQGRLVTGSGADHPLLKKELSSGVTPGLIGYASFPKILRACLTVGVEGSWDLDLDNAHMHAVVKRHASEK